MRSTQERQQALVEEVKTLLKEKGKTLDPELLARLSAAQTGGVESSASRFASFWRLMRLPVALLILALAVLLLYFLTAREPEAPTPGADLRPGRPGVERRR